MLESPQDPAAGGTLILPREGYGFIGNHFRRRFGLREAERTRGPFVLRGVARTVLTAAAPVDAGWRLPEQDLSVAPSRIPALPAEGVVVDGWRAKGASRAA